MFKARVYKVYILLFVLAFAVGHLNAALPKFLGGSGIGVSGNKANLEGKYPTFWDNLMVNQSYTNMYQGIRELSVSKYKEASQSFAKAVIKNPDDPYPHIFLGAALYWQGQVDQAMSEYRAALKLDPENAHAHQLMGIAYAWKGDINSALESFKKTVEIDPDRPDSQMNLGSTYAALGNYDEALFHFRNAVRLDKNHPLYHYQLGSLYEVMGRDNLAEDSFKKALRLYPNYEEAMLALAVLSEKQGSSTKAELNYRKALKIKPGDSVARFRLANLLARENRKDEAVEFISRAFLISPLSDEGLALSLSYSGGKENESEPSASAGDSNGGPNADSLKSDGGEQSLEDSSESNLPNTAPDLKMPPPDKQLDSFKKRLERIPADKPLNIDLEIQLEPKLKPSDLFDAPPEEGGVPIAPPSMLQASWEAAEKQALTRSFSRSFALRPSTEEERKEYIERIFNGLNDVLNNASKEYDVKMSIRGGAAVNDSSTLRNQSKSNSKAAYNPYMVGNDMGLWVAGKGWVKYVKEVGQEVSTRLSGGDGRDYMIAGLSALTLGEGKEALLSFTQAYDTAEKEGNKTLMEMALLGRGTAYIILGGEDEALKEYEAVLKLNPENKIALENKNILLSEK